MSLEVEPWSYDGPQWDNVARIVPTMFQSCEKSLHNISQWLKDQKLDEKFASILRSISEGNKRTVENDRGSRDRSEQLNLKLGAEVESMQRRIEEQDAHIKRIEQSLLRRLSLLPISNDLPITQQSSFSELDALFSKYFPEPESNPAASTQKSNKKNNNKHSTKRVSSSSRTTERHAEAIVEDTRGSGSGADSPGGFCTAPLGFEEQPKSKQRYSAADVSENNNSDDNNEDEMDSLEGENNYSEMFQRQNMRALWRIVSTCVHECYLNKSIQDVQIRVDRNQTFNSTQVNELLEDGREMRAAIRRANETMELELEKSNSRVDKLYALNLELYRVKLDRAVDDIEKLSEMKKSLKSIDEKFENRCEVLSNDLSKNALRITESKREIDERLIQLQDEIVACRIDQEKASTRFSGQLSESVRILNDQLAAERESFNRILTSSKRENEDFIGETQLFLSSSFENMQKVMTTIEKSTKDQLAVISNGISDIYPRIKEQASRISEFQADINSIANISNPLFIECLREKMSAFILTIWSKADKTESAVEKLIDTLLEHQNQLTAATSSKKAQFHDQQFRHTQQTRSPHKFVPLSTQIQGNNNNTTQNNLANYSSISHNSSSEKILRNDRLPEELMLPSNELNYRESSMTSSVVAAGPTGASAQKSDRRIQFQGASHNPNAIGTRNKLHKPSTSNSTGTNSNKHSQQQQQQQLSGNINETDRRRLWTAAAATSPSIMSGGNTQVMQHYSGIVGGTNDIEQVNQQQQQLQSGQVRTNSTLISPMGSATVGGSSRLHGVFGGKQQQQQYSDSAMVGGGVDPLSSFSSIQLAQEASIDGDQLLKPVLKNRGNSAAVNYRTKVISINTQDSSSGSVISKIKPNSTSFHHTPTYQQQFSQFSNGIGEKTYTEFYTSDSPRNSTARQSAALEHYKHVFPGRKESQQQQSQLLTQSQQPDQVFKRNLIDIKQKVLRKSSVKQAQYTLQQQQQQKYSIKRTDPFADVHVASSSPGK